MGDQLSGQITISVDLMGGDSAPEMVVAGLDMALKSHPGIKFLLFGDERQVRPLLAQYPKVAAVSELRHTDIVVTNDDKVAVALRNKRQSSMRLAINAVKDGEAQGVVSAGNTGALMAMAKFVLRTLSGISRPAIATLLPTMRGETVMLDLGANVECDAENLVQFAVMGEAFARTVLGHDRPTVGILNIGEEDLKGNDAVRLAAAMLQEASLDMDFKGFIEGDDIAKGTVDVVVTDGFTGNIALKTAEGIAKMLGEFLKQAFSSSLLAKLGAALALPALKAFKRRVDPRRYNGAMLLGLSGICVKSHGGTDALGFANAVGVCVGLIQNNINEDIKRQVGELIGGESEHHAQTA